MSQYKAYTPEQMEEHLSNFLISSWSYSKVSQFARNEKAFEMRYIYNYDFKSSATTVAGSAYHYAIEKYFLALKNNEEALQLVDLEKLAFQYIEEFPANKWKLQKTTPTVDDCIQKCIKTSTALLNNFIKEIEVYEIARVLDVELFIKDFITINGVDVPLPANMMLDLVIETTDGKTVIIDHKSKSVFSSEDDIALVAGIQAITYDTGYTAKTGIIVDEVWFIENKYSTNRNGSPQLTNFKVLMDDDTRILYQSLLYEPLRRMIEAVNNPDYVYLINNSDNFVDKADLYDFWASTMINEVDYFDVDPKKKDLVAKRLKKIRDVSVATISPTVIKNFKNNASKFITYDLTHKNMNNSEKIEHVLKTFGTVTQVAHTLEGYSSNTYLLEVSAGTKVTSVQKNKLDIANALNVSNVRISKDLVVYDGKSYVSVESSKKRDKTLFWEAKYLTDQKIPIGVDNLGNLIYWDLNNHSTPHLLIGGATGSGKSVSIESTIEYARLAGVENIIILDPKYEFTKYSNSSIEVYNTIEDIEAVMQLQVEEMQRLAKTGSKTKTMIVFDEMADAIAASRTGAELDVYEEIEVGFYKQSKEDMMMGLPLQPKTKRQKVARLKSLEENLKIILQKGRSLGFRIIGATQRASTKIITGDAKVNFTVQICFRMQSEVDSRVMLDEAGAESLAGAGDGLIKSPEYMDTVRFQAFFKA